MALPIALGPRIGEPLEVVTASEPIRAAAGPVSVKCQCRGVVAVRGA